MTDILTDKKDISNLKNRINNLRFYKRTLPEEDEYVQAKITKYEETGIYCNLLEYKKEAFLSFKDASSSKKLKNIKKQVLKNRNYILMVTAVNNEKGFIDVEKRTIDNEEQDKFTKLINFYEKIFNIFVKCFLLSKPTANDDDIYEFLEHTLWKEDPKLIMENFENIHMSDLQIIGKYNLDHPVGWKILEQLKNIIKKPVYKHTIKLNIRSLNIDAKSHIKNTINLLTNKCLFNIDNGEFKIFNPPIYMCEVTNTIEQGDATPDEYSNNLERLLTNFINEIKDSELSIKIEEITYKVV